MNTMESTTPDARSGRSESEDSMTDRKNNSRKHQPGSKSAPLQRHSRVLAAALMLLVASIPMTTDASTERQRRPLDLPAGGGKFIDDEEETLPDVIHFYGHEFEGDAFIWILDTSTSMILDGRIEHLKSEFIGAVSSLSSESEFGAVAFNSHLRPFDGHCSRATSARKLAASSWVSYLSPSGGTCMATALIHGLEMARETCKTNRRIIVVGDGVPSCGAQIDPAVALSHVSCANWDHIPIDAVFIGGGGAGFDFFQDLTESNGGILVISQ
jgi:Mg-chelatase subunit ChlD